MQITTNFSPVQKISGFKPSFRGIQGLENDSFEKSSENTFSAANLRKIITNPENEIGHGANNRVFSIPGNEKYVLRASKGYFNPEITTAKFVDTDKHLDFSIGQKVGYFITDGGFYGAPQTIELLVKEGGVSYGVPHYSAISDEEGNLLPDELPYEDISRKISFKTLLDKVSALDVEVYEEMLEKFTKAQDAGYSFDPFNPNNILIDDSSINLIDFDISSVKCSYIELLNSLTNHEYLSCFYMDQNIDESEKHDAYLKTTEIISKFLQAMQNSGLKFNHEYVRNRSCYDLLKSAEFKNAIGFDYDAGLSVNDYLAQMNLI